MTYSPGTGTPWVGPAVRVTTSSGAAVAPPAPSTRNPVARAAHSASDAVTRAMTRDTTHPPAVLDWLMLPKPSQQLSTRESHWSQEWLPSGTAHQPGGLR